MARSNNFIRSRTRSTFLSSLVTIALVLFFLNLFAAGAIYFNILFEWSQENFEVMVQLPDHVEQEKQIAFGKWLESQPFVKESKYISKEDAGKIWEAENGAEFMEIMDGVNPLPASYNFKLHLAYINSDSVERIQHQLEDQAILPVQDVTYPMSEIEQLRSNSTGMLRVGLLIGALVTLIAFFIVNSTVRLAIYAKRLVIRTMQLIGATSGFIRWPFVRMGIVQGALGALLADALLIGLVLALQYVDLGVGSLGMEGVHATDLLYRREFVVLSVGIVIFGAFLGWVSSTWAVSRFLNKNLDQLM